MRRVQSATQKVNDKLFIPMFPVAIPRDRDGLYSSCFTKPPPCYTDDKPQFHSKIITNDVIRKPNPYSLAFKQLKHEPLKASVQSTKVNIPNQNSTTHHVDVEDDLLKFKQRPRSAQTKQTKTEEWHAFKTPVIKTKQQEFLVERQFHFNHLVQQLEDVNGIKIRKAVHNFDTYGFK
ncbi:Hypothetical_protein [Hexamita inflata]|uniref:Hypothetical_protein n=1 Tax=Hexamita inflata TaxID=28002 RepID=A0ABP1KB08_9EUKA